MGSKEAGWGSAEEVAEKGHTGGLQSFFLGNSSQVEEQLTNIASANISMGETGGNK